MPMNQFQLNQPVLIMPAERDPWHGETAVVCDNGHDWIGVNPDVKPSCKLWYHPSDLRPWEPAPEEKQP